MSINFTEKLDYVLEFLEDAIQKDLQQVQDYAEKLKKLSPRAQVSAAVDQAEGLFLCDARLSFNEDAYASLKKNPQNNSPEDQLKYLAKFLSTELTVFASSGESTSWARNRRYAAEMAARGKLLRTIINVLN